MKTKEITLCGKTVNICYCLATEIAFFKFAGVGVEEFDAKNPEHPVHLILSGIVSWCEANGKQPEVTDHNIIFNADATEFVKALKTCSSSDKNGMPFQPDIAPRMQPPKNRQKKKTPKRL